MAEVTLRGKFFRQLLKTGELAVNNVSLTLKRIEGEEIPRAETSYSLAELAGFDPKEMKRALRKI
jgi:hypothetical protein